MAISKLYPPQIENVLPAFYKTYTMETEKEASKVSGAVIRVPYKLNRAVSSVDFKRMALRIKTIATNSVVCTVYTDSTGGIDKEDENRYIATFTLSAKQAAEINEGQYYLVQVAFCKNIDATEIENTVGYYSTLATIKCASMPTCEIAGFDVSKTNSFSTQFVGRYIQNTTFGDSSEKAYSYQFILWDIDGNEILNSGEQVHNTTEDIYSNESSDTFIINYNIQIGIVYTIQYRVKTINGLEVSSPIYKTMLTSSIPIDYPLALHATNNEEEGYIELKLVYSMGFTDNMPECPYVLSKELDEDQKQVYWADSDLNGVFTVKTSSVSGLFQITRGSDADNFFEWDIISRFRIDGGKLMPDIDGVEGTPLYTFKDFTIEQGRVYQYRIQQYNINEMYSEPIYMTQSVVASNSYTAYYNYKNQRTGILTTGERRVYFYKEKEFKITADFEHMFLTDGKRQLKVKFDPKVSSFKNSIPEQKIDTIGAKYPFIFRNGQVKYKEFPVAGLLSFQADLARMFLTQEEIETARAEWEVGGRAKGSNNHLQETTKEIRESTDLDTDNILTERIFKLTALEWLTDGEIKLFRSPTEGNYLVRLLNVQLSPVDSLGRMIHSFTCTAYEIADLTYDNLISFRLVNNSTPGLYTAQFGTSIPLSQAKKDEDGFYEIMTIVQDAPGGSKLIAKDFCPGDILKIKYTTEGEEQYVVIGATGAYQAINDERLFTSVSVKPNDMYNIDTFSRVINYQYDGQAIQKFDSVKNISSETHVAQPFIGPQTNLVEPFRMYYFSGESIPISQAVVDEDGYYYIINSDTVKYGLQATGFKPGDKVLIWEPNALGYKDIVLEYDDEILHNLSFKKDQNFTTVKVRPIDNDIRTISYQYETREGASKYSDNDIKHTKTEKEVSKALKENFSISLGDNAPKYKLMNLEILKVRRRELIPIYLMPADGYPNEVDTNNRYYAKNYKPENKDNRYVLTPFGTPYSTKADTWDLAKNNIVDGGHIPLTALSEDDDNDYTKIAAPTDIHTLASLTVDQSGFIIFQVYAPIYDLANKSTVNWEPTNYYYDTFRSDWINDYEPYFSINNSYNKKTGLLPEPDQMWIVGDVDEEKNLDSSNPNAKLVISNEDALFEVDQNTGERKLVGHREIVNGESIPTDGVEDMDRIYLYGTDEITLMNVGLPDRVVLGSGVMAELTYQIQVIDYIIEESSQDKNVYQAKEDYLTARSNYVEAITQYYKYYDIFQELEANDSDINKQIEDLRKEQNELIKDLENVKKLSGGDNSATFRSRIIKAQNDGVASISAELAKQKFLTPFTENNAPVYDSTKLKYTPRTVEQIAGARSNEADQNVNLEILIDSPEFVTQLVDPMRYILGNTYGGLIGGAKDINLNPLDGYERKTLQSLIEGSLVPLGRYFYNKENKVYDKDNRDDYLVGNIYSTSIMENLDILEKFISSLKTDNPSNEEIPTGIISNEQTKDWLQQRYTLNITALYRLWHIVNSDPNVQTKLNLDLTSSINLSNMFFMKYPELYSKTGQIDNNEISLDDFYVNGTEESWFDNNVGLITELRDDAKIRFGTFVYFFNASQENRKTIDAINIQIEKYEEEPTSVIHAVKSYEEQIYGNDTTEGIVQQIERWEVAKAQAIEAKKYKTEASDIANLDSIINAAEEQIKTLTAKKASIENLIEVMKRSREYIKYQETLDLLNDTQAKETFIGRMLIDAEEDYQNKLSEFNSAVNAYKSLLNNAIKNRDELSIEEQGYKDIEDQILTPIDTSITSQAIIDLYKQLEQNPNLSINIAVTENAIKAQREFADWAIKTAQQIFIDTAGDLQTAKDTENLTNQIKKMIEYYLGEWEEDKQAYSGNGIIMQKEAEIESLVQKKADINRVYNAYKSVSSTGLDEDALRAKVYETWTKYLKELEDSYTENIERRYGLI